MRRECWGVLLLGVAIISINLLLWAPGKFQDDINKCLCVCDQRQLEDQYQRIKQQYTQAQEELSKYKALANGLQTEIEKYNSNVTSNTYDCGATIAALEQKIAETNSTLLYSQQRIEAYDLGKEKCERELHEMQQSMDRQSNICPDHNSTQAWDNTVDLEGLCEGHLDKYTRNKNPVTPPKITEEASDIPFIKKYVQRDIPFTSLTIRTERPIVIDSFMFNKEFDILEIRLNELKNCVDYFIILEAEYDQLGRKKNLYLEEGLYKVADLRHKIVHVVVSESKVSSSSPNSWVYEEHMRDSIRIGIEKLPVKLKNSDIIIVSDADEILSAETVEFFKKYEGYPELTHVALRWSYYGFFWLNPRPTVVGAIFSYGLCKSKDFKLSDLRRRHKVNWVIGYQGQFVGWHCSWCFPVEDWLHKLETVLEPNMWWGKDEAKHKMEYLLENRKHGRWFDGSSDGYFTNTSDPQLAPKWAVENYNKFCHILTI